MSSLSDKPRYLTTMLALGNASGQMTPTPSCRLSASNTWPASRSNHIDYGKIARGQKINSEWMSTIRRQCARFTIGQRRSTRQLGIQAISTNDFRPGVNIELENAPWRVQEFLHVKPGKGAAFVRTKLKNYLTGNTIERTFRAGETIQEAVVEKDVKQYTYADGEDYIFMDMVSFEESRLNTADLGDNIKWLIEGMECNVLQWNNKVIGVDLPITVRLEVTQADPGLKGDTAGSGATKTVTVATGATLNVPLFVNQGDFIVVDTRTGSYMSRG